MRISRKCEYALRALIAMAREPRSWQIQEIAAREHIPEKFLEQIMTSLRRGGLLKSKRGIGGGYTMLRPASAITMGEVIRLIDGPIAPMPCAAPPQCEPCSCPEPATCALRMAMIGVREEIEAALDRRTIGDVMRLAPGGETLAFEI